MRGLIIAVEEVFPKPVSRDTLPHSVLVQPAYAPHVKRGACSCLNVIVGKLLSSRPAFSFETHSVQSVVACNSIVSELGSIFLHQTAPRMMRRRAPEAFQKNWAVGCVLTKSRCLQAVRGL